ncbi:hypothetical protein BDV23DRAFT_179450 [Aspergillus alliaceus]|uniref:Uncharacterized protein n=1 Tax=Petromyces alliaceus TaxID=209559 RepID=A0A5N7CKC2_PETAA|nr:hypothetical protein BDV23DRAFT_179450 [Aspergillus alliaceus]
MRKPLLEVLQGSSRGHAIYDESMQSTTSYTDTGLPESFKFGDLFIERAASYKGPVTFGTFIVALILSLTDHSPFCVSPGLKRRLDDITTPSRQPRQFDRKCQTSTPWSWTMNPINAAADAKAEVYWQGYSWSTGTQEVSKDFVFGETNSLAGGGAGSCPTYGAGLWILDCMMQGVLQGAKISASRAVIQYPERRGKEKANKHKSMSCSAKALHLHPSASPPTHYNPLFRGESSYWPFPSALALTGASRISQLDTGDDTYAACVIFDSNEKPLRALLYNSNFFTVGVRRKIEFS